MPDRNPTCAVNKRRSIRGKDHMKIPQVWYTIKFTCVGIFKQSIGARHQVRIGLSYRPARLYMMAELILWNRFFDSLSP